MEVRGNIGDVVFVKSKIRKIQIGEGGTSYCVQPEGVVDFRSCLLEVDAEDIMFETDAAAMLADTSRRLEEIKEDLEQDPKGFSTLEPELPAYTIPEAEPKRGRGRPKKATVEGLMAKAEQARIRREAEENPLWVENDT